MSGEGVVLTLDESARVAERIEQWRNNYLPVDDFAEWLLKQAVLCSIRIDRCWDNDWTLRMLAIERAETSWDEDRRRSAVELGAMLAKRPEVILYRIRRTRQGCEWILERWDALASLIRDGHDWTDAQRTLALDLLGLPREMREGSTLLDPPGVNDASLRAARLKVVQDEIAKLERLRVETLVGLDESEQTAAAMGRPYEPDKMVTLMSRYEGAASRRMEWALNELRERGRLAMARTASSPSSASPPTPASNPPSSVPGQDVPESVAPPVQEAKTAAAPPLPPEPRDVPKPFVSSPISAPMTISASTSPPSPGKASLLGLSNAATGNRRARLALRSQARRA